MPRNLPKINTDTVPNNDVADKIELADPIEVDIAQNSGISSESTGNPAEVDGTMTSHEATLPVNVINDSSNASSNTSINTSATHSEKGSEGTGKRKSKLTMGRKKSIDDSTIFRVPAPPTTPFHNRSVSCHNFQSIWALVYKVTCRA